jgi:predicted transposase/invertase (TIGR01784 family)
MRFLDVKTDYAFKRVFGSAQSKPVLIAFLNALLEYPTEQRITDLEIVDPYQIPLLKGMKDTYVDVKARLATGNHVIIEMQVLNVEGFEQRILYNAAKQYSTQLQRGEAYKLLNPVIAITFTDFILFDQPELQQRYQTSYRLLEKEHYIEYSGDIELLFIELPKFTKTIEEISEIKEQWIYFVKHAGELTCIPERLNAPELPIAFELSNESALSPEELELQHKRHDFIQLQRGSLEKAHQEGREEGEHTKAIAVARKLQPIMDNQQIANITGLTIQQIEALHDEET